MQAELRGICAECGKPQIVTFTILVEITGKGDNKARLDGGSHICTECGVSRVFVARARPITANGAK